MSWRKPSVFLILFFVAIVVITACSGSPDPDSEFKVNVYIVGVIDANHIQAFAVTNGGATAFTEANYNANTETLKGAIALQGEATVTLVIDDSLIEGSYSHEDGNSRWVTESHQEITFAVSYYGKNDDLEFSGGNGTKEDPYLIATPEQLYNVRNHLDKHFRQIAHIDLSSYSAGLGWEPIGLLSNNGFQGSLDGDSYRISNLMINRPDTDYIGLFANVEHGASIKNVVLEGVVIIGRSYVGGLVGSNKGMIEGSSSIGDVTGKYNVGGLTGILTIDGVISHSHAIGVVTGEDSVGGLVGLTESSGSIESSYAQGSAIGKSNIGGLVGGHSGGYLKNSYALVDVLGERYVGGLVGRHRYGDTIRYCYATGSVDGRIWVGGLVGYNEKAIFHSYATGDVTGEEFIGGLVGRNYTLDLIYCYATGSVSGEKDVGGLVGTNEGNIKQSYAKGVVDGEIRVGGLVGLSRYGTSISDTYASGNVTGVTQVGGLIGEISGILGHEVHVIHSYAIGTTTGNEHIGGLVGQMSGPTNTCWVTHSYYDQKTTGQSDTGKGIPKTTEEMMQQSTFIDWDFNFTWAIREGFSYPYLQWE